ncbi:hypothetical protein [Propioniciclava sp.]|uniref:hypothetical protein n=1 Tax=Propioniciclava sp. TaxID=2038686 RepID=UPI002D1FA16D|nr:hypothetical protein [Propioniciclava sp.]
MALLVASSWVPPLAIAAVAVALVGGFLATWAATIEFREWKDRAAQEGESARAAERDRTRVFHARQREVLATVDARTRAVQDSLNQAMTSLGESEAQASRLRGDNEALTIENGELRTENGELRTQLDKVAAASEEADVVALPVRLSTEESQRWSDLEAPTVVNLDLVRLANPLLDEVKQAHAN